VAVPFFCRNSSREQFHACVQPNGRRPHRRVRRSGRAFATEALHAAHRMVGKDAMRLIAQGRERLRMDLDECTRLTASTDFTAQP
jgi:hypothetical protein